MKPSENTSQERTYTLVPLSAYETRQIQIALSSRIEHLAAFLGDAETYPECVFQERIAEQKVECENVLERLRGVTV